MRVLALQTNESVVIHPFNMFMPSAPPTADRIVLKP